MSRPINLILDWDGTLTKKDTMFMMGNIASHRDRRLGGKSSAIATWKGFGEAYMKDFTDHQKNYQSHSPASSDATTPEELTQWLHSLNSVEKSSSDRVEASGFFQGVTQRDVETASGEALQTEEISLRKGWDTLFQRFTGQSVSNEKDISGHGKLSILSVNWSEAFIRTTLRTATETHPSLESAQRRAQQTHIDKMNIVANEIEGLTDPNGASGRLSKEIQTSNDKLQHFDRREGHLNVYVGDSDTDLDCLIAADVGICIRAEKESLANALTRIGWHASHIEDFGVSRQDRSTQLRNIWWARDFDEVNNFLAKVSLKA